MNSKTTLPISEARRKIFEIADEVQSPAIHFTLTENGRPKVVMMSADEYDSWVETLETIKDFPDLKKDIKETELALKSGEYKSWLTLEELLFKEGFVVADKSSKKYGISAKNKAKRAKRA